MTETSHRHYGWLLSMGFLTAIVLFCGWISLSSKPIQRSGVGPHLPPSDSNYAGARVLSDLSAAIADSTVPALVRITVTRPTGIAQDKELETFFGQLPAAKGTDIGSGFFVRQGGWIVTNYHVVRGGDSIQVDGVEGQGWLAKMHAYDALTDLAVLKVDATKSTLIEWGDCNRLKMGNFVWVAGAPFGLEASFSFGIISSLERDSLNGSPLRDYFQTDAAINPGSSGGPMVDIDGKVVGVVSTILGDAYSGIGFAIRGDMAQRVVEELIEHRMVRRGWIGVQLGQVTAEKAKKANLSSAAGALIEWIEPGEESRVPARKAGLMTGDICVRCNDRLISSQFELARKIGMTPPGEAITLELVRNSQQMVVTLIAMEKP